MLLGIDFLFYTGFGYLSDNVRGVYERDVACILLPYIYIHKYSCIR